MSWGYAWAHVAPGTECSRCRGSRERRPRAVAAWSYTYNPGRSERNARRDIPLCLGHAQRTAAKYAVPLEIPK